MTAVTVSCSAVIFFIVLSFSVGVCCGYLLKKHKKPRDLSEREPSLTQLHATYDNNIVPMSKSPDSNKQDRNLEMEENVAYGLFTVN